MLAGAVDIGPEVVLVTGMHRIGTSAVAAAACCLGASAPAHLTPTGVDNPLGFWESQILLHVDDWLLQQGQSMWYECLQFDTNTFDEPARRSALALIMLGVMTEFARAPLPMIKDPRICLQMDLWLSALAAMRLSTHVLLVLRHPNEVMGSLAKRDNLPPVLSATLWLRYMLAAERTTRGHARHVVSYDHLLRDPLECMHQAGQRAGIAWPRPLRALTDGDAACIDLLARHHSSLGFDNGHILEPWNTWLIEAYAALLAISQEGSLGAHTNRLDQVHQAFMSWCEAEGAAFTIQHLRSHRIHTLPRYELPASWLDLAQNMTRGAV